MRLPRFLLLVFLVTFIALVYVYQQSEILFLAYLGSKKQVTLAGLLDKNHIFRYNINRLSSLTCLNNKILRNVDFEIPVVKRLVRFDTNKDNTQINSESKKRTNLILNFFSRARQAQAQTLNR